MPNEFNKKRASFPPGQQRSLLNKILQTHSATDAAKICKLSSRTIRDWRRELYTADYYSLKKLCKTTGVIFPLQMCELKDRYWYVSLGAKNGGRHLAEILANNPDIQARRRRNWEIWWHTNGKYQKRKIFKRRVIRKPPKTNSLAEFVGIMIGDGGITNNQVVVSLNPEDDGAYVKFVSNLIRKLFGITPKIYSERDVRCVNVTVSSINLVEYCEYLGLKRGNKLKNGLDIPKWILSKKNYVKGCIRGIFDTDGCLFQEVHNIKGKKYAYLRLNFTTASPALASSLIQILEAFGYHPKTRHGGRAIQLENEKEICDYFNTFGTSNQKHGNRLNAFLGGVR